MHRPLQSLRHLLPPGFNHLWKGRQPSEQREVRGCHSGRRGNQLQGFVEQVEFIQAGIALGVPIGQSVNPRDGHERDTADGRQAQVMREPECFRVGSQSISTDQGVALFSNGIGATHCCIHRSSHCLRAELRPLAASGTGVRATEGGDTLVTWHRRLETGCRPPSALCSRSSRSLRWSLTASRALTSHVPARCHHICGWSISL